MRDELSWEHDQVLQVSLLEDNYHETLSLAANISSISRILPSSLTTLTSLI